MMVMMMTMMMMGMMIIMVIVVIMVMSSRPDTVCVGMALLLALLLCGGQEIKHVSEVGHGFVHSLAGRLHGGGGGR